MKHVLSVLVENKPGVLSRVTGLISRRGFNIESLSVGPTEDPTMSRVTAIVKRRRRGLRADHQAAAQADQRAQDHRPHRRPRPSSASWPCSRSTPRSERRSEIIEIANIFRAKIVDVGRGSLTIEATGDEEKLKGLEDLLRAYGIKEIVRTGKIAMSRNSKD